MQAGAQELVHSERLGGVAVLGERAHQEPVAALAVGGDLDERPARAEGGVELGPAEADARFRDTFVGAETDLLESGAALRDPGRVLVVEEAAQRGVQSDPRRRPGVDPGAWRRTFDSAR